MKRRKINRKQESNTEEKLLENVESNVTTKKIKVMNKIPKRMLESFFSLESYSLACNLLGKVFVRKIDSVICKGRIVETECYPGGDDKGSCTFNGKRTEATEPIYMSPGTLFVYMTYGMYYCLNISAAEPGGAVLIRALEPLDGIDDMRQRRIDQTKSKKEIKTVNLCNGPSKLCTSLQITKKDHNKCSLVTSDQLWIEDDPAFVKQTIIHTSRIGINSAGKEWAGKPFRFYLLDNDYVSKRDMKEEDKIREEIGDEK